MINKHRPKLAANNHKPLNPHNNPNISQLLKFRQSHKWKRISSYQRSCFPICQHLECTSIAKSVHHIKQALTNPKLFFEPSNLIPLCDLHHSHVSVLENTNNSIAAELLYEYWAEYYKQWALTNITI